jgi:tetratricopeptide (TPR) repeat protein
LVDNGELADAMEIAGNAALFWETRGYLTEGYELLSLIIDAARSLPQTAEKANLLLRAAICHGYRPPLDRSDRLLQEALEIAHQADAADVIVESLNRLASMADIRGRQEQRLALLEEFAREVERTGTRANIKGFSHLATAYAAAGRFQEAHAASAHAESMLAERADPRVAGIIMRDRADILWREGRVNEARAAFERALELSRDAGDANAWSACLFKAGRFYIATGDYSAASDVLRSAIEMRQTIGQPYWALEAVDQFVLLLDARGDYADALLVAQASAHLKGDSGVARAEDVPTRPHWDAVMSEAEQAAVTARAARMSFGDLFAFIAQHA